MQTPATPQPRTTTRNDKRASCAWETCPELVERLTLGEQQLNHLRVIQRPAGREINPLQHDLLRARAIGRRHLH